MTMSEGSKRWGRVPRPHPEAHGTGAGDRPGYWTAEKCRDYKTALRELLASGPEEFGGPHCSCAKCLTYREARARAHEVCGTTIRINGSATHGLAAPSPEEWNRRYDEATQRRDWATCDYLLSIRPLGA